MPSNLLKDTRPIQVIYFSNDQSSFMVGKAGCTKIEAYGENGEMAPVPWFAVYIKEVLRHRLNGKYIEQVVYGKEKP